MTRQLQKKRMEKMKKLTVLFAGLALFCLAADSPDSPYGVCAHVCKGEQWKLAEPKFSILKNGGVRWVRNGFTWGQAEPKQGVWDYSKLDLVAETAKKHGIDFLPILAYDVPWAHPAYRHLDQWREYVRRTVSRYAKQFRYWEIWNEPNINEKPGSLVPPENYVELLKAAHEEIKKIDPQLKVVFGGTAGVPVAYLEKCLKAGAAEYYDVMNIHPYLNRRKPEEVFKLLNPLFDLQKKYKAEKPVWVTEFSWPTHKYEPVMNPQVLGEALKIFGLDSKTAQVAVIRNQDLENFRGKAFAPEDYTVAFPNRKNISYEDLKNLDVRQFPVLVPSLTQAFPRAYFKDVVDYVRRGGVIIHSFGLPFYCDAARNADGRWIQNSGPDEKMMKDLHIKWLAGWRDNVPASGGGFSEITVPGGKRMTWAGQLVYEGLLPNGKVLTCPGIAKWNAYCWKDAYELTTQSARDFLAAGNGLLWQMAYGGYGLNCLVQGQPGFGRTYPRVRLGSVRQPSRKLLVADTRGKDIGGSPSANSSLEPAKMSGDAGGLNGGAAFGWHQETVNALFFDGHVKSVHGPNTTPQLFWIWTRSQPEFCFDNTQSADVSPWFMQ